MLSYDLVFFKQKTAYGLRISDWSSDVGSSDLRQPRALGEAVDDQKFVRAMNRAAARAHRVDHRNPARRDIIAVAHAAGRVPADRWQAERSTAALHQFEQARSEERPVGKECVSKCRSLWATDQ